MYKYYLNARPASPGAVPEGFAIIDEQDKGGRYGAIYYEKPLTDVQVMGYELQAELTKEQQRKGRAKMELKIVINGQEQVYKGISKKSCILKCLENNTILSNCFFANKGIIAAIEAGRDINKKEAEAAFTECAEGLYFEWVIPNGGARENAGRKSKGYKMVSIRMTEDEKEQVKEFLKRLRGQI